MAEVAVATTLGVIQIITPLLSKLNLPIDVEKDIESMRSWLSSIKAFMEDNHGRQGSRMLLDRVNKVRKIAYDIEDVVDEFILHSPPYTFHHHRITRKIHTFAHHLHHHFPLHRVSDKISSIRRDIDDMKSQWTAFSDVDRDSRPSSSSTNRVNPLLRDHEMVGYETVKTEFIRGLVSPEKRLVKLAVDGPAGSGKTTLVKNVFWKPEIQARFDCHAWVCVSQNFDIEKISENLLKQLCSSRKEAYPGDDGSTVQTRLRRYLTGKRYVVVLDDIWRHEDWVSLKDALPDSFRGSRIIVTTANSNVSSFCASSSHDHVWSLPFLQFLDSWKLFCRKAFLDGECPAEMKDTSMKLVTRCEGLPLAIVTVAGAVVRKPWHEWETFHNNLGRKIGNGSDLSAISEVLLRSYMDLSSSLKCCFLYMSLFPEDYSVERGRLIRLWVTERFAMATEDQTAEEVAEDYLNELIQRNVVHVSKWDFDGRPRNCRVINIILKFIIKKCKDENFASVFPRENTSQAQTIQNQIRRLSVHDHCKHFPGNGDFASVRSLFLLRLPEISPLDFDSKLCKLKFKLVKVLDVQGAPLTEFPKQITHFTLVTYLSFRDTKIKLIPSSIQKLSYLETLDLKQTDVVELPKEISHLQNLCHLFVYKYKVSDYVDFDSVEGVKLHEGIGRLTNLQNLSLVKVGAKGRILKELRELIQLRKLGLTGLKREHGKGLCAAVEVMKSLRTLDVCSATKDEYIELEEIENPPDTLQRLYLKGRLKIIPSWVPKLDHLLRIGLKWSKLSHTPLETLKRLPNLTELQLVDCFTGEEFIFEASGFKKLKILLIEDFNNLNMMVIQNGSMPELKKISLRTCPRMMMLLGVDNLIKVEELTLYDMADEFVGRLRADGEDREWVKRVPLIHSFTLTNQCWSLDNLSDSVSFVRI